jgi:hypothetical protein
MSFLHDIFGQEMDPEMDAKAFLKSQSAGSIKKSQLSICLAA